VRTSDLQQTSSSAGAAAAVAANKLLHSNFKFHCQKLWDTLKHKFIYNLEVPAMNALAQYLGESLL
jgi:hypothetical protein